jgi:hypothetical protein
MTITELTRAVTLSTFSDMTTIVTFECALLNTVDLSGLSDGFDQFLNDDTIVNTHITGREDRTSLFDSSFS